MTFKQQLELMADIIGGKAWGIDKYKPRIYLQYRRDVNCYFSFPDAVYPDGDTDVEDTAGDIGGSRLNVYIDDCGQHPNWYKKQKSDVMQSYMKHSLALSAITHCEDEGLARQIMEIDEKLTAQEIDDASHHLINGRSEEAREVLFGGIAAAGGE